MKISTAGDNSEPRFQRYDESGARTEGSSARVTTGSWAFAMKTMMIRVGSLSAAKPIEREVVSEDVKPGELQLYPGSGTTRCRTSLKEAGGSFTRF